MADDPATLLTAAAGQLGLVLTPAQRDAFSVYLAELDRWNDVAHLTAYRTERARVLHLILESLLMLPLLPSEPSPLLDIGSGAGVPGLILKVARPGLEVTLVEANRRRANFLRHITRTLSLQGVTLIQARAETLAGQPGLQGAFRVVIVRAVAQIERALALARPFVGPEGRLIIPLPSRSASRTLPGQVRRVGLTPVLPLVRSFLILG